MVQLVLEEQGRRIEVEVAIDGPGARVHDLLTALGHPGAAGACIDGRAVGAGVALSDSGLLVGSIVSATADGPVTELTPIVPDTMRGTSNLIIAVIAGPDAGATHRLDGPTLLIGRDPCCDLTWVTPASRSTMRASASPRTAP